MSKHVYISCSYAILEDLIEVFSKIYVLNPELGVILRFVENNNAKVEFSP